MVRKGSRVGGKKKKRVTKSEGNSLTLEKNACFWLQRKFNSMVKGLTETMVLFLLRPTPQSLIPYDT